MLSAIEKSGPRTADFCARLRRPGNPLDALAHVAGRGAEVDDVAHRVRLQHAREVHLRAVDHVNLAPIVDEHLALKLSERRHPSPALDVRRCA